MALGDLVHPEPVPRRTQQAGEMSLDIIDIFHLVSQRVLDINHYQLPVGFFLVDESEDPEHLDLLDVARVGYGTAYLARVDGVVIPSFACVWVGVIGVLPCLCKHEF